MPPIRRVVFLDSDGKPIRPRPSRPTPLEREVQADALEQERMVEFGESRAPAPRQASVRHTVLPAAVGAAQELVHVRRSTALRKPARRQRTRRRRSAARRDSTRGRVRRVRRTSDTVRPRRRVLQRVGRTKRARRNAGTRAGTRMARRRTRSRSR